MNANINFLGIIKYLACLRNAGLISDKEAKRFAHVIAAKTGADMIVLE